MSTFGLTWDLKSPDRKKQFISSIPRNVQNIKPNVLRYTDTNNVQNMKPMFKDTQTHIMYTYETYV